MNLAEIPPFDDAKLAELTKVIDDYRKKRQERMEEEKSGDRRKLAQPIGFSERRHQDRRAMQRANMLRMQSEED
jgi:hypothetical protein